MVRSTICYMLFLVASVFLLSVFSDAQQTVGPLVGGGINDLLPEECQPKCDYRCSETKHRKEYCMSFCLKCCAKCLCVPPGTSGNKEVCPCYNDWKTKEGKPKCP